MVKLFTWLKKHWALVILLLIAANWLRSNYFTKNLSSGRSSLPSTAVTMEYGSAVKSLPPTGGGVVPPTDTANRLVINDTSLSLQVKDVADVIRQIENTAKDMGGFLISSYLSKPELAANGNISVRVPEARRPEALEGFKTFGVKTVSESVYGVDVTDQYVDLESRLAVLIKTKQKFEDIMNRAVAINDLLNIQQQLINLQSQIDSIKGQQKYYEQSAKLTKITVYLSTDELALPYSPTNEWRPTVIFKQAVRSLVSSLRIIVGLIIWIIVYVPIIIPIGLIYLWYRRRQKR